MSRETWFRKVGRKYVPIVEAEKYDHITMPANGVTLTYRQDGLTQWEYKVRPDNAGFMAAAMVARTAMEAAINEAATYKPQASMRPYTKRQLALIEQFKADMGMRYLAWWEQTSARDIAQAGIDAVSGGGNA